MPFVLTTSDDRRIDDPDAATIETVLRSLTEEASFLILGPGEDEGTFMQAAGDAGSGFTLEYCEGAPERLYQCTINPLPVDHVILALRAYLRGDDTYKRSLQWEHVELG